MCCIVVDHVRSLPRPKTVADYVLNVKDVCDPSVGKYRTEIPCVSVSVLGELGTEGHYRNQIDGGRVGPR